MKPWVGHGRTRKRRQIRKPTKSGNSDLSMTDGDRASSQDTVPEVKKTRRGRIINKPTRYCLINQLPQGSTCQQGEVVRQDHVRTWHVQEGAKTTLEVV